MRSGRGWLIEKDYAEDPGLPNPMYVNLPDHEAAAMAHLHPYGLAPELVAYRPAGPGVGAQVVYRFVPGVPWKRGVAEVAQLLCAVHHVPVPTGWRRLHRSAAEALVHADAMVADTRDAALRKRLARMRPTGARAVGPRSLSVVHTDCGPGNIVRARQGLVLIDWQCPGVGDAVEDVACFASGAMQLLYARPPHTPVARQAFLDAYDDADSRGSVARYLRDGAAWHYRIAAYCAWRIPHTRRLQPAVAEGYARALAAEQVLLEGWGS